MNIMGDCCLSFNISFPLWIYQICICKDPELKAGKEAAGSCPKNLMVLDDEHMTACGQKTRRTFLNILNSLRLEIVGESIQMMLAIDFLNTIYREVLIIFLFEMQESNKIFYEPQDYDGNHTH